MTAPPVAPPRVALGRIHAHRVRFDEAIDHIFAVVDAGAGGYVVTPNVDHVVMAEHDDALAAAYRDAALSLVDGKPLLWLSQALHTPLPEKISGSDIAEPLCRAAAARGRSVFLLGAQDGVGAAAADALRARIPGLVISGVLSPPFGFERDPAENARVIAAVRAAQPALVLVALGAPKQELWMHTHAAALAPAVLLGIGATLDFIAGRVRRAPSWMSQVGLEWAFRLAQEPRRMAQRYLVRDRAIVGIAWRQWRGQRP